MCWQYMKNPQFQKKMEEEEEEDKDKNYIKNLTKC